eukprot:m.62455 g.62455  ORF g.62455 m.62455 type:complete len:447 (+) comp23158_c0_seq1:267-1607(+)
MMLGFRKLSTLAVLSMVVLSSFHLTATCSNDVDEAINIGQCEGENCDELADSSTELYVPGLTLGQLDEETQAKIKSLRSTVLAATQELEASKQELRDLLSAVGLPEDDIVEADPYWRLPRNMTHSVINTDYDSGKFLSIHSTKWRTGGLPDCEDDPAPHNKCAEWALQGECELNPSYLHQHCAKSCNLCRTSLPFNERCVRHPAERSAIEPPHGLDRMYHRILTDPDIVEKYTPYAVSKDPWVVVFENFVSEDEGNELFSHLPDKWTVSTTVGDLDAKGDVDLTKAGKGARTSTTAWCSMNPCSRSDVHLEIQKRVAYVTGTDPQHMEFMQVLNYEPGQYYKAHHDNIGETVNNMCGPRLLTAFFYFTNAGPDDGGATAFPSLNITVKPKVGRMVLWPSMLATDNTRPDMRTTHEAMNVTSGNKKAANLWIHEFDFKTGYGLGCCT